MSGIVAQNVLDGSGLVKAPEGGGAWTLLSTQTASSSATLSFTSGIDSTYPIYVFKFINLHPATDNAEFNFNMSVDGGSNYNVTKTTTDFRAFQTEDGTSTDLGYEGSLDLENNTGFQIIAQSIDDANDASASGYIRLFNPSSTTFVKHFVGVSQLVYDSTYSMCEHFAGYGNTTSAVDSIQFKMTSGNIDAGKIKLYGIKDS